MLEEFLVDKRVDYVDKQSSGVCDVVDRFSSILLHGFLLSLGEVGVRTGNRFAINADTFSSSKVGSMGRLTGFCTSKP